jgi:hypothetical protein
MRKLFIALLTAALLLVALAINSGDRRSDTSKLPLRVGLSPSERVTVDMNQLNLAQALIMYSELTGRTQLPKNTPISQQVDECFGGYLSRWHLVKRPPQIRSGIEYHRDGLFTVVEVKEHLDSFFAANAFVLVPDGKKHFRIIQSSKP